MLFRTGGADIARLTILANGNIGISSSTPSERLVVNGNVLVTGTVTAEGGIGLLGDLNMNNNLVLNIGNAGTNFTSTGGLNLAGDFAINTDKLTVNSATGNVGVGTTTPTSLFVVGDNNQFTVSSGGNVGAAGTITATGQAILNGGLTMDGGMFSVADGTGNTSIAGTLGVTGTTTLSNTLQVDGGTVDIDVAADISGITTISNTTVSSSKDTGALVVEGGVGIEKDLYVGADLHVTGDSYLGNVIIESDLIKFNNASTTSTTDDMLFRTGGVADARLTITAGGNIGVGSTTPSTKFVVDGGTKITGNLSVDGCFGPVYQSSVAVTDGSIGAGGYSAADAACSAVTAGSHVCRVDEVMNSRSCGSAGLPTTGAYWLNSGSTNAGSNDCSGWTSNSVSDFGAFWDFDANGGKSMITVCSNSLLVACCK